MTLLSLFLLLFCGTVWAQNNFTDDVLKSVNRRVNEMKKLLPEATFAAPLNASSDGPTSAIVQTSIYNIVFRSNWTQYEEFQQNLISVFDRNTDGNITQPEVKDGIAKLLGFDDKKGMGNRIGGYIYNKLPLSNMAFDALDNNDDNQVSVPEFKEACDRIVYIPINLPSDYQEVCNQFSGMVDKCNGIASELDANDPLIQSIQMQKTMCSSGFSLLFENFDSEECVIKADQKSVKKSQTCNVDSIRRCFKNRKTTIFDSVDGTETAGIQKRSIPLVTGVPFQVAPVVSGAAFWVDAWFLVPVLGMIALAFMSSLGLAVTISSTQNIKKYWYNANEYERWQLGNELPLCGTPIIFWSDQCGSLGSNRSHTCPRGQPLYRQACGAWWSYGSRECGMLGCQSLCFDISDRSCPRGQKFRLGYDDSGKSISLSYFGN